jgi:hypothetical protein
MKKPCRPAGACHLSPIFPSAYALGAVGMQIAPHPPHGSPDFLISGISENQWSVWFFQR